MSTIFQLMVAGHDTTASLIGNSLVALFRNPAQLAKLREEPTRLPAALEEFLRFDAPVPHSTFRYAVEPVTLAGRRDPCRRPGHHLHGSRQSRSRQIREPESLDLDREVTRHLAFGHGVHHCLGAPLARMEGQIALGSLLARFPELSLAVSSEDLHWDHGDGLVLRGLSELPVIPGPAVPRPNGAGLPESEHKVMTTGPGVRQDEEQWRVVDAGWGRKAVEFATLERARQLPGVRHHAPPTGGEQR